LSRRTSTGVYAIVVLVVCPFVAYRLAVAAANDGVDTRGFLIVLLGVPILIAGIAGLLLRRTRRGTAMGALAGVAAAAAFLVVLVFLTLER
jgi:LPXTG-motif cell wall-anchored protein